MIRSGSLLRCRSGFSVMDVLRMKDGRHGVTRTRGMTGSGIVASLTATEATAFLDTFGTFGGGELE